MAEVKAKCEAPHVDKSCKSRNSLGIPPNISSNRLSGHLRSEPGKECVVVIDIELPAGGSPSASLHYHVFGGAGTEESSGSAAAERMASDPLIEVVVGSE
jgi:hypothetical protein